MRKFFLLAFIFLFVTGTEEVLGQMNRKAIKRNNKKMYSYRGKRAFGKERIYSSVGISVSALNYFGDLAPKPSRLSTDISFTRPAIGISFTHRFGPRYQLMGQFMYGTLRGSDAKSADKGDDDNGIYRYQRNLSFRNRIKELTVVASIDWFENQSTYISRVQWTPYAFIGLSILHHNPKAQVPETDLNGNPFPNAGEWVELQPLGTEGQNADLPGGAVNKGLKPYKRIQPAIPIGIGARFRINQVMDFSAEIGFRYLFTDYIDDVSGNYVDLDQLDSELARAMSYRTNEVRGTPPPVTSGGPSVNSGGYIVWRGYGSESKTNLRGSKNDKDIYMVTSFRLSYIIGKSFNRAKFR